MISQKEEERFSSGAHQNSMEVVELRSPEGGY